MDVRTVNVESFNPDHRTVHAPYIRLEDKKTLPQGSSISKYDVRFLQPNRGRLETTVVHSIEHLFTENVRRHSKRVIDFSSMDSQTGFYLTLEGEWDMEDVLNLVEYVMEDVMKTDEVLAVDDSQCGEEDDHTVAGAHAAVHDFLDQRSSWGQVF